MVFTPYVAHTRRKIDGAVNAYRGALRPIGAWPLIRDIDDWSYLDGAVELYAKLRGFWDTAGCKYEG